MWLSNHRSGAASQGSPFDLSGFHARPRPPGRAPGLALAAWWLAEKPEENGPSPPACLFARRAAATRLARASRRRFPSPIVDVFGISKLWWWKRVSQCPPRRLSHESVFAPQAY